MEERFFLTLVRHGETMENRDGVIQGQADTALSETGLKQAALAGKRLQHERFTHMFTSDLRRAADTAAAIADANLVSVCQLVKDKRLRERSFGIMEGKKFSELQDLLKERKISFKSYTPKEGESIEQVHKRATSFFNETCRLILSHSRLSKATTSSTISSGSSQYTCMSSSSDESRAVLNTIKSLNIDTSAYPSSTSTPSSDLHTATFVAAESRVDPDVSNILVVGHGLLLKELKKIILNHYAGELPKDVASFANHVSPNTGISKFSMSVSNEGRMTIRCLQTLFLDCKSHLRPLEAEELGESKY